MSEDRAPYRLDPVPATQPVIARHVTRFYARGKGFATLARAARYEAKRRIRERVRPLLAQVMGEPWRATLDDWQKAYGVLYPAQWCGTVEWLLRPDDGCFTSERPFCLLAWRHAVDTEAAVVIAEFQTEAQQA